MTLVYHTHVNVCGKCTNIVFTTLIQFHRNGSWDFLFLFYCSTRWKANEFSLGSYTAIGVGSSQLDIEHIARPMHVNNNKIVSRVDDGALSFKYLQTRVYSL